jgi:hypothetical protein
LVRRKYFTIFYILVYNRYRVQTSVLVDSRTNSLVFINNRFATDLVKFLGTEIIPLTTLCSVKGFDRKPGQPAIQVITLNLGIDKYRQQKILILILNLGNYNFILEKK